MATPGSSFTPTPLGLEDNLGVNTDKANGNKKTVFLKSRDYNAGIPGNRIQLEITNNQSVRRHLDAFTRGRIIGKLEEGRSVTSVAAEFGIAHSIIS
ncbi:hypothetical protein TNCV_2309881 [Trichonephila clavipes]|nr:hypothetical protein TNCV_2309881 [Trichonephila clavipes]